MGRSISGLVIRICDFRFVFNRFIVFGVLLGRDDEVSGRFGELYYFRRGFWFYFRI